MEVDPHAVAALVGVPLVAAAVAIYDPGALAPLRRNIVAWFIRRRRRRSKDRV